MLAEEEENGQSAQKNEQKEFIPWYMKQDIAQTYESWYEGKYKRADDLEKNVLKLMIDQFSDPRTILEVGCGTAHFTRWFGTIGLEAKGIDLSPFMLREAKKYWPQGELVNARSSNIPFPSESFDIVAFITCFEYMPEPIQVLKEAARVARRGIVFGLMNSWSLPTLRRKFQLAFGKNDYYRNAHFYSIREMKNLAKEAFGDSHKLIKWRTTLFPKGIGLDRDSGIPFGAFLGVAIQK